MEINPLLVRESRARWRGWRGFALVLGYAVLLAGMMAVFYGVSVSESGYGPTDSGTKASQLGASLFMNLTWMQALGWMFVAPALTAPSIAGERENGLLEALFLAPIEPRRILGGKLLAIFLFIMLVMAVALPPTAICFILGGVSPGEFYGALALHLATAAFCASLGLCCSAWSRRAGVALLAALMIVGAWGFTSMISFWFGMIPGAWWGSYGAELWRLYGLTNPIYSALALTLDEFSTGLASGGPTMLDIPAWCVSPLAQSVATIGLWLIAVRGLRRPLPEPQWMSATPATNVPPSGPITGPTAKPRRVWRELPIARLVVPSNPVLQREMRSKFRIRQPSPWAVGCLSPLLLAGAGLYIWLWFEAYSERSGRDGIWWGCAFIGLSALVLMCGVMGAGAFTRERESGTWEALGLSLLPRRDIIVGKLLPPIVAVFAYSVAFWPMLWLSVQSLPFNRARDGVSLDEVLATLFLMGASAWYLTAFGLYISWRSRRTATATGVTLGILFFAFLLVPTCFAILDADTDWMAFWHPFIGFAAIASGGSGSPLWQWLAPAFSYFFGCGWLFLLSRAMDDGVRERDSRRADEVMYRLVGE